MKLLFRSLMAALLVLGVLAVPASAQITVDQSKNASEIFTSPNQATNSDLAFWGNHAFIGYYTGSDAGVPAGTGPRGGVRIFDISNPDSPQLVKDLQCDGLQADPIVWDRNGNGVADLLLVAVDRTMEGPECGADRSNTPKGCVPPATPPATCVPNHADIDGWEGVRVFEMSDDPDNPFETIEQVKAQYTDCGAHTITAWTGFAEDPTNPRLIVYVSSYPLRAGPTCGKADPASTTDGYQNMANPFDEDKGSPNTPLHGVIQVLEVPLDNPAGTHEIAQPKLHYPGDPDGVNEWCERGFCSTPASPLEAAAIACHDIVTHMEHNLAGAACAEQGQVWEVDPDTGIPDTENPMMVGDDELSSGGTGQFPGAVDFFHSVMFNNAGTVVNWVDESFGEGCPTMTEWNARDWHPAGEHKTGRMFFSDMEGNFLSEFHVGDLRPNSQLDAQGNELEYCSAHMGMAVMGIKRDLLVNAWYTGGMDVIDFSKPTSLKEIAFYDPARVTGTWSAYPYAGPLFKGGPGRIPIYTSDGVEQNINAQGMVVYRVNGIPRPGRNGLVDHLNPQTMDMEMAMGGGNGKGKGHDKEKSKGKGPKK
jgi:hypothetical protein